MTNSKRTTSAETVNEFLLLRVEDNEHRPSLTYGSGKIQNLRGYHSSLTMSSRQSFTSSDRYVEAGHFIRSLDAGTRAYAVAAVVWWLPVRLNP